MMDVETVSRSAVDVLNVLSQTAHRMSSSAAMGCVLPVIVVAMVKQTVPTRPMKLTVVSYSRVANITTRTVSCSKTLLQLKQLSMN